MNLFKKRRYVPVNIDTGKNDGSTATPVIPDGMWIKCPSCGKTIYKKELSDFKICPVCGGYFRLKAWDRINMTVDPNTFFELDSNMVSKNPLNYPDYKNKIEAIRIKTNLNEAVISGICLIDGLEIMLCVMDSHFIMGSMGSVVGEKITHAFEYATEKKIPVVIFTASGGARMQEGIISLMQMAKISAAVKRHSEAGLLYITVLTDPTTGGVTASFAMLGDIILSEPKALIGFAGRRVIEQTINQKLPDDFQTAEFFLEHGFIDKIVERENIRKTIASILRLHNER